jgi:opacity protein-like surface antigen
MYMKKFVNVVAVAVLVLSAAATSAQPQSGDVGVFADQAGTLSTFSLVPFNSTQRVHVVGFDLGDLKSFEFGVNGFDGWFVFGTQINGNLNLGGAFSDVGFADFIVGTGGCIDGSGAIWLATITFGDFTGLPVVDRPLCMRASSSTATFQGVPGVLPLRRFRSPGPAGSGVRRRPERWGILPGRLPDRESVAGGGSGFPGRRQLR